MPKAYQLGVIRQISPQITTPNAITHTWADEALVFTDFLPRPLSEAHVRRVPIANRITTRAILAAVQKTSIGSDHPRGGAISCKIKMLAMSVTRSRDWLRRRFRR